MGLSEQFTAELNMILDERIRAFAANGLDVAPAYLATVPASLTGRNHPPDERGPGGRVLHIKRVARITYELAAPMRWDNHLRDCMVAAALLHDIVVLGVGQEPLDHTYKAHDSAAMEYLLNHGLSGMLEAPDKWTIQRAIAGHMGRWASEPCLENRPGEPEHYLHIADYIASLPCVKVKAASEEMS